MITQQEFFNKVCDSLRSNGNPYGGVGVRGWGWINPDNNTQRCAIAQIIPGDCSTDIVGNICKLINLDMVDFDIWDKAPVIPKIVMLFDYEPEKCNNKEQLEIELQKIAEICNLVYTAPKQESVISCVSVNQEDLITI